jgi:16S rRNA (cytidine1402-2'-O)-methyltransferase
MSVYESPHRIVDCIQDCVDVFGGQREGVIARELTKIHETVTRGPLSKLLEVVKVTFNTIRIHTIVQTTRRIYSGHCSQI